MINRYNDYIRVAANITDLVLLANVCAVAFTENLPQADVLDFVNNPVNNDKLVYMLDSSTGKTISLDDKLLQVNAVAYITADASGNSIVNDQTYYVSVVPTNQGNYQPVNQYTVDPLP